MVYQWIQNGCRDWLMNNKTRIQANSFSRRRRRNKLHPIEQSGSTEKSEVVFENPNSLGTINTPVGHQQKELC